MKKPDPAAKIKKIEKVIRQNLAAVGRSNKEKANAYRVIGQQLIKAKKAHKRGEYLPWAMKEFGWTRQHCARYVQLAKLRQPEVVERMEHGYSIWVKTPVLTASKVSVAQRTGHLLSAITTSEHPDHRKPDPLTALQKVINSTREFAKLFLTEKVVEAAKHQATTLGPEKLNDLIDTVDEQRTLWTELLAALKTAKTQASQHHAVPVRKAS